MNNLQIPFANLNAEMAALQERSEYYQSKITALKVVAREINHDEIQKISRLDNECQSAIAFCFSRK